MSFEIILPFLKPIEHLLLKHDHLRDHGQSRCFGLDRGRRTKYSRCQESASRKAHLTGLEVIANRFGKKLDADSPIMNLRLPDGSRMAALIPPVVNPRPLMTIRKFTSRNFTMDDLIAREMLTEEQAGTLAVSVQTGRQSTDLRWSRVRQDHTAERAGRVHPRSRPHSGHRRHGGTVYKETACHIRRGATRYA